MQVDVFSQKPLTAASQVESCPRIPANQTNAIKFKGNLNNDSFVKQFQTTQQPVSFEGFLNKPFAKLFKQHPNVKEAFDQVLMGNYEKVPDLKKALNHKGIKEEDYIQVIRYLKEQLIESCSKEPTMGKAKTLFELNAFPELVSQMFAAKKDYYFSKESLNPFAQKNTKKKLDKIMTVCNAMINIKDSTTQERMLKQLKEVAEAHIRQSNSNFIKLLSVGVIADNATEVQDLESLARITNSPGLGPFVRTEACSRISGVYDKLIGNKNIDDQEYLLALLEVTLGMLNNITLQENINKDLKIQAADAIKSLLLNQKTPKEKREKLVKQYFKL